MSMPIQNLTQWSIANGYPTKYDILSHIHAGLRSAPQTKTYQRWWNNTIIELQAKVSLAESLYREAIENGSVIHPDSLLSRQEKLIQVAKGHPDNEAVQAARRLVYKKYNILIE
jgi:hypothetical protein